MTQTYILNYGDISGANESYLKARLQYKSGRYTIVCRMPYFYWLSLTNFEISLFGKFMATLAQLKTQMSFGCSTIMTLHPKPTVTLLFIRLSKYYASRHRKN